MKLSILDQSLLIEGKTGADAVRDTVSLAIAADELGFHRIWLSEHHNLSFLQGSSPIVLLSAIGAQTKQIRIGSGGVMLPNHSAFHIAENFRMLESLYPNRVDCGIGRASGGDAFSRSLLNGNDRITNQDFEQQVSALDMYLHDECKRAKANPSTLKAPPIWMLSGGGHRNSGIYPAENGLGLAIAAFINPNPTPDAAVEYIRRFKPSEELPEPKIILAYNCICAEDPKRLAQLKKLSDLFRLTRDSGNYMQYVPSADKLDDIHFSKQQKEYLESISGRELVGNAKQIFEQAKKIGADFYSDEIMLSMISYTLEDRISAIKALSETFQLNKKIDKNEK